jgi:flagellar hook-associated protein 2
VTTLAAAQVSASQTYTSTDAIVGGAGQTLTLTPASGDPVTITLTGDTTLQQLANQINSRTEPPATASIVQISPGHYQLVLTAAATGTDNAFTIRSTMTGGEGLTFSDKDGDGVSGDDPEDTTRAAADASFTVNGLHVTSSSNTASDVIPGVTLSLNKASANAVVSVTRDSAGTKDLVKKFIDAYNAVVQFTKDQQTASNNGQTNIARDPLLRGFRDNLRSALLGEYSGGSYARLAEIGLGFDRDGKMVLDTATFDKAMASTPNEVQKLFSGDAGDGGAFGAISTLIDGYTGAGGLVAGIRNRLDDEAAGIGRRMDSMSAALEIRRQSLQREYIAADLAMTQLKSQSGSLANLGNGLSF